MTAAASQVCSCGAQEKLRKLARGARGHTEGEGAGPGCASLLSRAGTPAMGLPSCPPCPRHSGKRSPRRQVAMCRWCAFASRARWAVGSLSPSLGLSTAFKALCSCVSPGRYFDTHCCVRSLGVRREPALAEAAWLSRACRAHCQLHRSLTPPLRQCLALLPSLHSKGLDCVCYACARSHRRLVLCRRTSIRPFLASHGRRIGFARRALTL